MTLLWFPLAVQALCFGVDEFFFHFRRGLPRWERIGHPVDTLTVIALAALAASVPYSEEVSQWFLILGVLSCLCITKDEWVHARYCRPGENWLHAVMLILHPVSLWSIFRFWEKGYTLEIMLILISLGAVFVYQLLYWNWIDRGRRFLRGEND